MNAREKAWTYYRDVVLEKSGEMICGEIFLKMAANVFVLDCGEFCSAKMWFIRQRQMVLVFLILRSYDEDDDNEEESEKSSSSSKTSGCRVWERAVLLLRKTSLLGEDSCCRGGIVNIRFGCSRALLHTASSVPRRFGGFV